jgi:class 3 adenylate cyclase/CheY-like chemotaxis protein/DNA polymerase III delta prime subunit
MDCPACRTANPPAAKFCAQCGTSLSAAPRAPPAEAERRQLTVMFVDLVGSTALSGRLDPEEMGGLLRAYQNAVAGEVMRFEGHVAKFMGDGVLAYFGWPKAHEDAAERAVCAGLEIVAAVARLTAPTGDNLLARVGIATGPVVVGDPIGEGAAREQAVVGDTTNLAARLQTFAEPGGVVIAPTTRCLVGDEFKYADLGVHTFKGLTAPVRSWRVRGRGRAEGRFEARQATTGPTPLVGREQEVALLLDRWQRAKGGEGQVVLLAGEPGIGKSRVVHALRERLGGEPHTPLSHDCSPLHQTSALHPIIGQLERAAGFARDDPPGRKLDKLEALLARGTEGVAAAAPLIAALLAIPAGDRYPPLNLSPRQQKGRIFEALLGQLAGLAAEQPVLALYEDVHWSDPTTLELLELVVDRVQRRPALVLITFRPEFVPPWTGYSHITLLALTRLGRRQGAALVERLTGGRTLPAELVDQIVARADGVPLFLEELTKAVLVSELLKDEGDRYALAGPASAVPATLQDSLLARLDRLTPAAKEVAQIGAAIGRDFSHELLAAVAPLPEETLRDALDQLIEAELVFCRGAPPEATYSFKHTLVRDAAYESPLKSKLRKLHARIAQVLEERFPASAEAEPELLAHHCAKAGLVEKAVGYRHRAGQRVALVQPARGLEPARGPPAGSEEAPPTILLVEDEALVALDIRRTLQRFGYTVCATAATADDAVRIAAAMRPDVVLMDIRLQGPRDGISAAAEIRQRLELPIVYITAHADPQTRAWAAATSPSWFVSKPFSGEALRRVVDQALANRTRP